MRHLGARGQELGVENDIEKAQLLRYSAFKVNAKSPPVLSSCHIVSRYYTDNFKQFNARVRKDVLLC